MFTSKVNKIMMFLYVVSWLGYLILLTYIVLFKGSWDDTWEFMRMVYHGTTLERRKVYLRPFESTSMFLELWEYSYARWNIMGNILLFVPLGVLTRGLGKGWKGLLMAFGLSFITSLGYELIQFLYGIVEFDVDDIKCTGSFAGIWICLCRLLCFGREGASGVDGIVPYPPTTYYASGTRRLNL